MEQFWENVQKSFHTVAGKVPWIIEFWNKCLFLGKPSKKLISKISKGQKHQLEVVLEENNTSVTPIRIRFYIK